MISLLPKLNLVVKQAPAGKSWRKRDAITEDPAEEQKSRIKSQTILE